MTPEEKISAKIIKAHRRQQITDCGIGRTITEELVKYKTNIRKEVLQQTKESVSELLQALEELG